MFEQYITPHEINFVIALVLSLVAGYVIGAEREARGKDAGISTHTMVITGAMLFSYMSLTIDPESTSRIAAQIVTGIGFLGAGLIIKEGANVKNLTTAASIWFSGAIGMALGFSYYGLAVIATLACAFIPRIPHFNKFSPEALNFREIISKELQRTHLLKKKNFPPKQEGL